MSHELHVAVLLGQLERLFLLVVLLLQVGISQLHVVIVDSGIGEGTKENACLSVVSIECGLGRDVVRLYAGGKQTFVLGDEELLAQVLLHKLPVLVESVELLLILRILLHSCVQLVVVSLNAVILETTGLLIDEIGQKGHGHQHLTGTFFQHTLHLVVGNHKTQLLGLSANEDALQVVLPHGIAKVVDLLFAHVLAATQHLHHFLILFYHFGVVLDVQFFTHDLTNLLTLLVARSLTRAPHVASNKSKQGQGDDTYEPWSPASDFTNCCHLIFCFLLFNFRYFQIQPTKVLIFGETTAFF